MSILPNLRYEISCITADLDVIFCQVQNMFCISKLWSMVQAKTSRVATQSEYPKYMYLYVRFVRIRIGAKTLQDPYVSIV
jgi:hypothetical protein